MGGAGRRENTHIVAVGALVKGTKIISRVPAVVAVAAAPFFQLRRNGDDVHRKNARKDARRSVLAQ